MSAKKVEKKFDNQIFICANVSSGIHVNHNEKEQLFVATESQGKVKLLNDTIVF